MKQWLNQKPLSTGAAAIYPYSAELEMRFSAVSRYDDPYPMYRVFGPENKRMIALPRMLCPMGEKDLRKRGEEVEFNSLFEARSTEQSRVVAESTKLLLAGASHITQAPTGFGKTWCAMDVIANVGRKTLVVVTKEDLRDQWILAGKTVLGLGRRDIGLIQGDICAVTGRKLVIAMIQSLSILGRYPPSVFAGFGLTLFDEVHRVAADHFSNTCFVLPSKLRWGLSATPERQDGKEQLLYANIGQVQVKTEEMMLRPIVHVAYTDVRFPRGLKIHPGRTAHLTRIVAKNLKRNHFIAKWVYKLWTKKRNIIVFSATRAHLEWLRGAFIKVGIPDKHMAYYVGGLSRAERNQAKGKQILLATYAYTSEATDIPWLDACVLATPKSNVVQIIGRILREYPNKATPLVLDLVDPFKLYGNFGVRRRRWYNEIGAPIKVVKYD